MRRKVMIIFKSLVKFVISELEIQLKWYQRKHVLLEKC